jgi:glutamine cyclotransferase
MKNLILLMAYISIVFSVQVIEMYNHDPDCYTQGL